jgi:hypothetical protein
VAGIFAELDAPNIRRIDGTGDAVTVHGLIMENVAGLFPA